MKRKFKPNHYLYNNYNNKRSGGIVGQIMPTYTKTVNPADLDKQNRQNVIEKIKTHIDKGGNLDKILDELCKDEEINKQFEYLKRKGMNLRNLFETWYKSYEKSSKRKLNWYTTGGIINKEKSDENETR